MNSGSSLADNTDSSRFMLILGAVICGFPSADPATGSSQNQMAGLS